MKEKVEAPFCITLIPIAPQTHCSKTQRGIKMSFGNIRQPNLHLSVERSSGKIHSLSARP